MNRDQELYDRITRLRTEAFELIDALARTEQLDEDTASTLALVRLQAVANGLGRVQNDLKSEVL
jgi:hypothetical protein